VHRFRFGLAATTLPDSGAVEELARRSEGAGFATLLTADHLGPMSPFPPLLAAAGATSDLRVGTFVINNELHHPLRLAQDAATIDLLTGGRFELGVGSGWNKAEFDAMGLAYDRPSVRAGRLADSIRTVKRAWGGEPTVSVSGTELPAVSRPVQDPLPLLIGGHSDAVLRLAAEEAQIVGFTGLTWSNGSLVPSGATAQAMAERVRFVRDAAGPRAESLELNVLVQVCEIGDGAEQALDSLVEQFGIERSVLDESPLVLAGSAAQVKDKLQSLREEVGLSYFVVFDRALDPMTEVVAALAGT
jgi:probable F420-dependent oxidoreductase